MLSELPEDVRHQIELEAHRERSRRMIIGGVIWLVIGIGITLVTHDMASSAGGGTYIVAYGPVIAGIIYLLKGLLSSPPSRR